MNQEKRKFDAEVGKVLQLMIHSLYANKEIFLRELISNASDACDKLRYISQTDATLNQNNEYRIDVSVDKEHKTITIRDTGIGMNYDDLNENLGTIAKSGTQRFLSELSGDNKKDSNLIGQFGVGFYSSFMVADQVTVTSRKAGEDKTYTWSSDGQGEYTIAETTVKFDRGTEVKLHLKASEEEFLDAFKIKHIIKSYSDHISVPIYYADQNAQLIQVNSCSALWAKAKSEVTEEQYNDFYKSISYAHDKPWLILHNHNEGVVEFINLLFIPSSKTFDLFHPDRKCRVKLYVKRVFINDDNINIVPQYLRFLRGVIDSSDLPLNISRETLQHNAVLEKIKKSVTKKVLSELSKQKEEHFEEYLQFWHNFGSVLKEGLCEIDSDHDKLLEVCVFKSALQDKMISLDDYIQCCEGDNKTIYYLSGENPEQLKKHPQIAGFLSKGIDVLLFTDTVDGFWVNVNGKYRDIEIKSVTRSDIDLSDVKSASTEQSGDEQENTQDMSSLIDFFKKTLSGLVRDVVISKKLTSIPACLAVADGAMDIRMERYLIEQKQLLNSSAKILEINPNHKIIAKVAKLLEDHEHEQQVQELVHILYDQACIIEGEPVHDIAAFTQRVNHILEKI